jgi:hypothetical protein
MPSVGIMPGEEGGGPAFANIPERVPPERLAEFDRLMAEGGTAALIKALEAEAATIRA